MGGVHGKPLTGRGVQRRFRDGPGPGRGDTEFRSINGAGNGRKMEKMAKIREIPEKSHNPNPTEIILFEATGHFKKIKTFAKMHQKYQMEFLNVF